MLRISSVFLAIAAADEIQEEAMTISIIARGA